MLQSEWFLMAQWLGRASHGYEMLYHELDVMGSNPDWAELGVHIVILSKMDLNQKYEA